MIIKQYGEILGVKTAIICGVGYDKQLKELRDGVQVIVGTPGRLLDHINSGNIEMDTIGSLILTKSIVCWIWNFDDIRRIVNKCPKSRQTIMVSATVPDAIQRIAQWALKDPVIIDAGTRRTPAETIEHAIFPVDIFRRVTSCLLY